MSRRMQYLLIGIIIVLILTFSVGYWKQADAAKIQKEQCRQFFSNNLSEAELNYKSFCKSIEDEAEISEVPDSYNVVIQELTLANCQYTMLGEKSGFVEEPQYYEEEAIVELQRQIMKCLEVYVAYVESGRKNKSDFSSQYLMMEEEVEKNFQKLQLDKK